jgi:hypothetical protein
MIYIDPADLGYSVYLDAWVAKFKDEFYEEFWYEMIDKWIDKMFRSKAMCKDLVPCSDINII